MGGYLQVSTPLTSSPPPSLSSPPPQKTNLPMLYYGLVVVATAAVVLAFYNLIIVRWCTIQYQRRLQQENQLSRRRRNPTSTMSPALSRGGSGICLLSSFKFKKGEEGTKNQLDFDTECSVCISVFEEGEEVRKLPMCDHCFHAHCIDMWLYSHIDCPLCRTPVVEQPPPPPPPG